MSPALNEGNSFKFCLGCGANCLAGAGIPLFNSVDDCVVLVKVFADFLPRVPVALPIEGKGNGRGFTLTEDVLALLGLRVLENLGGTGGGKLGGGWRGGNRS